MNENGYYIPPEDPVPKDEKSESVFTTPEAPVSAPAPEYDRRSVITRACSSGMFLAICILTLIYTLICGLPNLTINFTQNDWSFNSQANIPLIPLLITIGLWVVHSSAKKDELSASGMKLISGSLKAVKIVNWITAIIMIVCAVLTVLGGIAMQAEELNIGSFISYDEVDIEELNELLAQFEGTIPNQIIDAIYDIFTDPDVLSILIIGIGVVFGVVGLGMMFVNIFFYGCLYKFARSLREWGEGEGLGIKAVRGAANWLIVSAVFSCIGAMSFSVRSGLMAAICIVVSVFIKKHFYDHAA